MNETNGTNMDVDAEKLIFLIEPRTTIYNNKEKEYSNKNVVEKLWKEIAVDMNCEVSACKTKWTNLRNTYCRYLRDENKLSGASRKRKKKWYLADAMSFLKSYITQHHITSSSLDSSDTDESMDVLKSTDSPAYHDELQKTSSPVPYKKSKILASEMIAGPLIEFLKRKTQTETAASGFFKTLLSDYEKLSTKRQRTFRLEMLQRMNELQDDSYRKCRISCSSTQQKKSQSRFRKEYKDIEDENDILLSEEEDETIQNNVTDDPLHEESKIQNKKPSEEIIITPVINWKNNNDISLSNKKFIKTDTSLIDHEYSQQISNNTDQEVYLEPHLNVVNEPHNNIDEEENLHSATACTNSTNSLHISSQPEQSLQNCVEGIVDEDISFLQSLYPELKKLNNNRKRRCKLQVMSTIYKFLDEEEAN